MVSYNVFMRLYFSILLLSFACTSQQRTESNSASFADSTATDTATTDVRDSASFNDWEAVAEFIALVKKGDKEELARHVQYPLWRRYPIPEIYTPEEFVRRYDEIFDDSITQLILSSDPKEDWTTMGWRGVMLHQGDVWLNEDGTLIGVNYQPALEEARWKREVEADRILVHESLKEYVNPCVILETPTHRIRIDELPDDKYRYASWKLNAAMSTLPELVIINGELNPDGNGGNHHYIFKNKSFTYECYINVIGTEESPDANLMIYKEEKEISAQDATIVKKK